MDESKTLSGASLSPQIMRDYNVIRLLGKGGMGDVYLAEQLRVGRRPVALKVLNRLCCENPDLKRRFENEAASAGRIHHPNVVLVYECRATDDGQLYVAMQYVEGSDLGQVIEERGVLPLGEIVEIAKQAAAGLSAAHKLGIVHRDIKPANIMLTRDDDGELVVKVLDFGIARLSEPDSTGAQTKTGVVMGTPHYMSPEQALGKTGDRIDSRSDIYSLAMAVYQMLTGRVAFESDSWMQVIYKHINESPLPPSQLRPELANMGRIDQVILKGLEKDREKRYQTVTEFANDLAAACTRLRAGSTLAYGEGRHTSAGIDGRDTVRLGSGTDEIEVTDPSGEPQKGTVTITPQEVGSFKSITTTPPSKPPASASSVHVGAAPTTSAGWSPGKKIAAVISAVVLLGLAAAAYVVTRGPGTARQVIEPAASEPGGPGAQARREANARNAAEHKDEARREAAAARAGEGEPARPERNPRETSPVVAPPAPFQVTTGKEATGEGTCLGVAVTRAGKPLEGCFLTLTDQPSGRTYEARTGATGFNRFCGLVAGRQVTIRVVGPGGKPIGNRTLVLRAGSNPLAFQG